jgi:hypothetical protein
VPKQIHDLEAIKAKYANKANLDQAIKHMAGKMADELINQTPKKKESSWTDILQNY